MGAVEIVIYMAQSIWGAYTIYLLFELFFDTSHLSVRQKIMIFGIYNLVTDLVYLKLNIPIITLGTNIVFLILIAYIYKKNYKEIIVPSILIMLVIVGGEAISLSIVEFENFYLFKDNPLVSTEIALLTRITTYFIVLLLKYFKNIKSAIDIPIRHHLMIISISSISFYVIILLVGYRDIGILWRTTAIIGMVIINIGIFYLYNSINEYMVAKLEKTLYQKESEYYHNQSEILSQALEKDHKMRHDTKNNLQSIYFLIEKGEYKQAQNYIASIENHYKVKQEILKTGVTIIDSILNYKLEQAENKSIEYKLNISIPNTLNINYFDIGVVLGNMIDNALEALVKLPKKRRKLNINIIHNKGVLKIEVKNTYNGNIKISESQILTTKEDSKNHGQGIKIIRSIAEKHGDYIDITHNGKWFNISILLLENQP